jgi:tagatose-1,6-bisphosphate aldolase non-catalytic subunit AgaZ/GatZ
MNQKKYWKQYYQKNKQHIKLFQRKYYKNNKQRIFLRNKKWFKKIENMHAKCDVFGIKIIKKK